jgi:hypothetical protein
MWECMGVCVGKGKVDSVMTGPEAMSDPFSSVWQVFLFQET